ncbi:hypothetical protein C0992_007310, partial [Termitomyces sp. T32_za158]
SFVILASSLAALASAVAVDRTLNTVTNALTGPAVIDTTLSTFAAPVDSTTWTSAVFESTGQLVEGPVSQCTAKDLRV